MKFAIAEPDEYAFVYDSWARSFQKSRYAGCIPNNLYPQVSRAGSADIINRGAKILIAYADMEDGSRRIMGYSVSEPERGILHWLFVKQSYRKLGVGKALLAETTKDFSSERIYTYRTDASLPFLGPTWEWKAKLARVRG